MLCQNTGSTPARFQIDGMPGESQRYVVQPGESVEIADGYCTPYVSPTRREMPPIVTQLHKAMVPRPGEYAPGMSPELHETKGIPPVAMKEIANLSARVAELTRLVASMAANQAPPAARPPAARPPAVPPPPAPEPDEDPVTDGGGFDPGDTEATALMKHSKPDLIGMARELGARAEDKMTKAQLVEAILATQSDPEDA